VFISAYVFILIVRTILNSVLREEFLELETTVVGMAIGWSGTSGYMNYSG